MADAPLEIWSKKPSFLSYKGDEHLELDGHVILPDDVKGELENIHLPRDEDVACLSSLQVNNLAQNSEYRIAFKISPFSWHLGLNKARKEINQHIADKYPNRHEIGLDAGIMPCGIMGITLTRDGKFLLGERNPKATHTVGNYCLAPAGFLGFDKPGAKNDKIISETFNREFFEEVLYGPDLFDKAPDEEDQRRINSLVNSYSVQGQLPADGLSPKIVGLTYEDKNNRGFGIPIIFKTSFTSAGLDEYLKMKKPDVEHKGYLLREFSPGSIEDLVRKQGRGLEIHSLGALLCAGANEFDNGDEWYKKMTEEVVPQNYGRILTLPEKTFSGKRNVVEIIKETALQRYA